jgi:hypothetical protein
MIGSRTSPVPEVVSPGVGLAVADGLSDVDGATVGLRAAEGDGPALGEAVGLCDAGIETENLHVVRSTCPSADLAVDSTVNEPSLKAASRRAIMRRSLSGSTAPVPTVAPLASLTTSRLPAIRSSE